MSRRMLGRSVAMAVGLAVLLPRLLLAQVSVTATLGTLGPTSYTTLRDAFAAINAGAHQGAIRVSITANVTESPNSANLNSSGAGSASYTSVIVQPTVDNVTITATSGTGTGIIQLNGADNVVIDGDNPNTPGTNRNLTITQTSATNLYKSVIRIATSAATTTADNITIRNLVLNGSAVDRNTTSQSSVASVAAVTFGIYVGGNGSTTAAGSPAALNSATSNAAIDGTEINHLVIENNAVNQCGRGIVFNGANTSVSAGVTITGNVIGAAGTASPPIPPFTSPTNTVYVKGIWVKGAAAISVTGNTLRNIISYVQTTSAAIELLSPLGATVVVADNVIGTVAVNSTTATSGVVAKGVAVTDVPSSCTVTGNRVTNVQSLARAPGTCGIEVTGPAASAIERNVVTTIYSRSIAATGVYGVNIDDGVGALVRNNMISDVKQTMTGGSAFSTTLGVFGVRVASGTNLKIFHNSVNLFGTLFGSSANDLLSAALAIVSSSSSGCDVRNNVFVNTLDGGNAGIAHVCLFLPSGAGSGMNLTLDHNAYVCGSSSSRSGLAQVGTVAGTGRYPAGGFDPATTTPATNLRSYTSQLSGAGTNDGRSIGVVGGVPFVAATDLHVANGTASILEARGSGATGVTSDIDGQSRPGPPGSVNGGGIANDLGADEFDGRPIPALGCDRNPISCTETARFIATVGAGASGFMQFSDGATDLGSAPVTDGYAILSTAVSTSGTRAIRANYSGDGQHPAGTSDPLSLSVNVVTTETAISIPSDPVFVGDPTTLSATITPSDVTGSVEFLDADVVIGVEQVASGAASYSATFSTSGSHVLKARYTGQGCHAPSTSSATTIDVHANPFLTSSPNPSQCGTKVDLTVALSVGGTGSVDFREGGISRGVVTVVNNHATLSLSDLTIGDHTFVAVYSGDATHPATSSDPYVHAVVGVGTTTSLTVNPGPTECTRTLIATMSPSSLTGSVEFTDGGVLVGSAPIADGVAAVQRAFTRGQHVFKATYGGGGCILSSQSSPKTVSVGTTSSVTLISDLSPSAIDEKVTLIAYVTPTNATGTVRFLDQGQATLGTATLVNGAATLSRTFTTPGSYSMTARYDGDSCNVASQSGSYTQVVVPTRSTTSLTSEMNPTTCGANVHLIATVTPSGSQGTVTFREGSRVLGTSSVAGGIANLTVALVTLGPHSLQADFSGTPSTTPSTSPTYVQTINPPWIADPGLFSDHTPRVGEQVVLTAFVNPAESPGEFEFLDGPVSLGYGTIVNGTTSITVTFNRAGRHFLRSVYSGNDCIEGQTSDYLIQVVNPAATQPAPAVATATRVFQFAIDRITPNPVRRAATIDYGVANTANLRMRIVDVQGRVVETLLNGPQPAGQYQVRWNARGAGGRLPAGIYFVRYEVPGKVLVKRFVLQ